MYKGELYPAIIFHFCAVAHLTQKGNLNIHCQRNAPGVNRDLLCSAFIIFKLLFTASADSRSVT